MDELKTDASVERTLKKSLQIESLKEEVALAEEQAIRLEDKFRATERVVKQIETDPATRHWMCIGRESFIKLPRDATLKQLEIQSRNLWSEVDAVQRVVTSKSEALERAQEAEE